MLEGFRAAPSFRQKAPASGDQGSSGGSLRAESHNPQLSRQRPRRRGSQATERRPQSRRAVSGDPRPTLTVRGKGRFGGKYRSIPMDPMTRAVLERWVAVKAGAEDLYPVSHTTANWELAAQRKRVGVQVRVTGHVLRRSFGRIAYQAGAPPPTIQRIFGHVSVDKTLHKIGVGQEGMTEVLAAFYTHIHAGLASQRQTVF
jgi:Phage integrase family